MQQTRQYCEVVVVGVVGVNAQQEELMMSIIRRNKIRQTEEKSL